MQQFKKIFFNFSGEKCEQKGCPGVGSSCSGHGYCDETNQLCYCNRYWKGVGCNLPNCPGDPDDCNNKGKKT